jgi:hypothetical protein
VSVLTADKATKKINSTSKKDLAIFIHFWFLFRKNGIMEAHVLPAPVGTDKITFFPPNRDSLTLI